MMWGIEKVSLWGLLCQDVRGNTLYPVNFKDKWHVKSFFRGWIRRGDHCCCQIYTSGNNVSCLLKCSSKTWGWVWIFLLFEQLFLVLWMKLLTPGVPVPSGRTNPNLWAQGTKVMKTSLCWAVKSGTTKPLCYYLGLQSLQTLSPMRAFNDAGSSNSTWRRPLCGDRLSWHSSSWRPPPEPPPVSNQSTPMIHRWYTNDTLTPQEVARKHHKSWDLHQQLPGRMRAALASSVEAESGVRVCLLACLRVSIRPSCGASGPPTPPRWLIALSSLRRLSYGWLFLWKERKNSILFD